MLALAIILGIANLTPPAADAADTYAEEKEARLDEYRNKFDLAQLLWNTNGKDASGKEVDYGGSARNYLYWQGVVLEYK